MTRARRRVRRVASVAAASAAAIGIGLAGLVPLAWRGSVALAEVQSPLSPLPTPPALDPARVKLGEALFHDPILSSRQALACNSCHDLSRGGTIKRDRSVGYDGRVHEFNVPTLFNVANSYRMGWRGQLTSLSDKTDQVLTAPNLMANDWETLLPRLRRSRAYGVRFMAAYGRQPDREAVLDALVTFQRSLATPNAPFDRFLKGDERAITPQQRAGYDLFRSYGCASCHQGSNVGGNMSQIFGVFGGVEGPRPDSVQSHPAGPPAASLADASDERHVYRVPSLRNVAVTAPYFHDGRTDSLSEAVDIMGRSQLGRMLSETDIAAITAFLESLTGEYDGKPLVAAPVEDRR
ncbi:cytochrome-c peroxidase [Bosea sp. (in: a-proteobacteria)]|uniref:cytochrome-c peroxidase n=1 Tax=Bosea sp. (in: a-proteobacteria) TaxID=1871050 RepID=UPI002734BA6E|nr:cytochrome c peroxidase [Bosea sp. (in: a-proteobacteria)]MDP3410364.1 cytochrome c peroxidase [Bosea sp. (in: a-proteobacteria)]